MVDIFQNVIFCDFPNSVEVPFDRSAEFHAIVPRRRVSVGAAVDSISSRTSLHNFINWDETAILNEQLTGKSQAQDSTLCEYTSTSQKIPKYDLYLNILRSTKLSECTHV